MERPPPRRLPPEPLAAEPVFEMRLKLGPRVVFETPRGGRVFAPVEGGEVSGPRLTASVQGGSGADFGFLRPDRVEDVQFHYMLKAADGTDIHVKHFGYRREADGYCRVSAYFDAPQSSAHAWLNNTVIIGRGEPGEGDSEMRFSFHALR